MACNRSMTRVRASIWIWAVGVAFTCTVVVAIPFGALGGFGCCILSSTWVAFTVQVEVVVPESATPLKFTVSPIAMFAIVPLHIPLMLNFVAASVCTMNVKGGEIVVAVKPLVEVATTVAPW